MRTFLNILLSDSGTISSKRVISFVALFMVLVVLIISFCGIIIPEYMWYSLIGLVGFAQTLTKIGNSK